MIAVTSVRTGRQRVLLRAGVACWLTATIAVLVVLADHASRPGAKGARPVAWPRESPLELDAERPTLVVFIHPHCPCSQATVSELERLAARTGRAARMHAVLVTAGLPDGWRNSVPAERLRRLADTAMFVDTDGAEARRFGAETSGAVYLFGADGKRLFEGGVTAARGHEGDNAGLLAAEAILCGREPHTRETAVFGCPLFGDSGP